MVLCAEQVLFKDGGGVANISSCSHQLSHLLCVLGLLADIRLIKSVLHQHAHLHIHTESEYQNGTAWPVETRLIHNVYIRVKVKQMTVHIFNAPCSI